MKLVGFAPELAVVEDVVVVVVDVVDVVVVRYLRT